MGVREAFARNLRIYRKLACLTQEELAQKAGLHRTYIGGIEQERVNPSLRNIGKIADALHIDAALLFLSPADGKPLPRAIRERPEKPEQDYALVQWTEDGIVIHPLDAHYDDLTIQVILDLIRRGYSGNELVEEYNRTAGKVADFLANGEARSD